MLVVKIPIWNVRNFNIKDHSFNQSYLEREEFNQICVVTDKHYEKNNMTGIIRYQNFEKKEYTCLLIVPTQLLFYVLWYTLHMLKFTGVSNKLGQQNNSTLNRICSHDETWCCAHSHFKCFSKRSIFSSRCWC